MVGRVKPEGILLTLIDGIGLTGSAILLCRAHAHV